ncbi:hypothetical protein PFISCL1PPCAC_14088, partial [Pristionchus fissidentatus]
MKHTPKAFANFGLVLRFHVMNDILTIFAAFAVMNRVIPIDDSFVYIAHGPCGWLGTTTCYVTYGLMTMGASMTLYIVLVSFVVRLRIMQSRATSNRAIGFALAATVLPVPSVIFVSDYSVIIVIENILMSCLAEYRQTEQTIFSGIADVRSDSMTIMITLMIFALIPLYFLILHVR